MFEIKRPGVIFYFDSIRPSISRMSKDQIADLFVAVLDYAEYGVAPELDLIGSIVFDMLRPKIDLDGEKYVKDTLQKMYAAYCREEKRFEREPLKYSKWKTCRMTSADDDRHQYISISENENEPVSETGTVNKNLNTTETAIERGCVEKKREPLNKTQKKPKTDLGFENENLAVAFDVAVDIDNAVECDVESGETHAPSLSDIQEYIDQRGSSVNAQRVYDYYAAADWKDKNGKPVNWKQRVISWEQYEPKKQELSQLLTDDFFDSFGKG